MSEVGYMAHRQKNVAHPCPTPTIDDILPQLSKAKVFSVLDAKDGFWQGKLDEPSSYSTTFWTPFGRYR